MKKTIAIIGAGPAGSMLAHKLAAGDHKVSLYDHKAPWEKPCGGMLRPATIAENPELERYPYPINFCPGIDYISAGNDRQFIPAKKAIPVVARNQFNRFLLDLAIHSGADFINKKVQNVIQDNSLWIIKTNDHFEKADLIVGADGANSIVRRETVGKFSHGQLVQTCGYLGSGIPDNLHVMSFLDIEGYLWLFSRPDHISAGIGTKMGAVSGKDLFAKLDGFLADHFPAFKAKDKFSALIPMADDQYYYDKPCCGDNWLLVGDAAGHVDSIVGEGIYFALASAESAARAIFAEDIPSYDTLWRKKFGSELKQRAALRQTLSSLARTFSPEAIGEMVFRFLVQ